jgi:carboxylate-amine ligase
LTRTFGVEEELLLVHRDHASPKAAGQAVVGATQGILAAADSPLGAGSVDQEFKQEQAEIGSEPCRESAEMRSQLQELRSATASAAAARLARIVAVGTSPLKIGPTPTDEDRYARMTDRFGLIARQQLTCGQHVHVEIGSRAEGVAVIDRIGVWLPTVLALSANSPFWQGQDTGYASFRTIMWGLWPTAGPAGPFGDEAGYDAAVADLVSTGAAMDEGMIYFDARLSGRYPTVEIRVADVCTDVDDAVLIGVICRALVDTAAAAWRTGTPAPRVAPQMQRAAMWRAARFGVSGGLVDPDSRMVVPAAEAVAAMIELLTPALVDNGDGALVAQGIARILGGGTGAERQRAAFHSADGDLTAVVDDAARRTLGGDS